MNPIHISPSGLTVHSNEGTPLLSLPLSFSVGTQSFQVRELVETESGYTGKTADPSVSVEIIRTDSGCSVELTGEFAGVDTLHYFNGGRVEASRGRAFVPDADCREFETRNDEQFVLTNSGMILQKRLQKKDLWMIAPPPHVLSFGDLHTGWCGLSIPEPLPVTYTAFTCSNQKFGLQFDHYSFPHAKGRAPRVFIEAGLSDGKEILDRHRKRAESLGLITGSRPDQKWWHNPVYCTWGDQCYQNKTLSRELEDPLVVPLSGEEILRWADGVRKLYDGEVNFIVDTAWFKAMGEFRPNPTLFPKEEDFMQVLNRLREQNFRVILWYTPFWVQREAKVAIQHPDWMIRRRNGDVYRDEDDRTFLDYSRPEVRQFAQEQLEYMLKELDADGFKIDMNYVMPLMSDVVMHDSQWGYGNQLWLEVLKFFHQTATNIKPDVFFTISGIESYLQPFAQSVRLNDLFDFDNARSWYDRAEMVTRLMPGVLIDVDGWPSSPEKMREYQFVSPVFGAPVTYYIESVDIGMRDLTPAELNRMASVWNVYGKVPCSADMQLTIDAEHDRFERRDADGTLRAVALQKSVLACYSYDAIYLTANSERGVSVPVPTAMKFSRAEKVSRDGKREEVFFARDGDRLLLHLDDAGTGILYYKIS